jgi:hypothetical protein
MKKERLPNTAVGRFCQMLADRRYQENCAKRAMAGDADHLLTATLREEHTPHKTGQTRRGNRLEIEYRFYDAHPEAVADIEDEQSRAMIERYLRRRAAGRAELEQHVEVVRSRFLELDQFLRPGLARERFLVRWRAGKVTRRLEIEIRKIADTMDAVDSTSPRVHRIVLLGPQRDPMARPRATAADP